MPDPAPNRSQLSIGHTERAAQDTTDPRARREAEMAEQEKKLDEAANAPSSSGGEKSLEDRIIAVLKQIYDPEIPVSVYDLGLIYNIEIDEEKNVTTTMTLTTPACPVAQELPEQVRAAVGRVREVKESHVELTFDPPWSQDNLSEEAKLELGLM
ncbi:iron-sulfur cluster assembly protein [Phycisphaerales bacterium AB-hyl4]|uniref:Iron-sulfur cluster assembly protein n=1 Tax=Natronomicrosphaera hydrolytica TaxID=3242702 RepID=A0ABV4UAK1_9BACT